MTDTITPEQPNNSTTNVDIAESIELLKNQIAELKAQVTIPKKETIEFLPSQTNSNKTLLIEREKGAVLSTECDALERNIMDHKELLQSTMREGIDTFIAEMQTKCIDDNGLMDRELKRNLLAFLNCKAFFDIDGVEIPEHLQAKVNKVKQAKSYSLAIKDEVNELLSHLPYMTKKLREMEERKKNANVDFHGMNVAKKQSPNYYIKQYSMGLVTLEECKKHLPEEYKEKLQEFILRKTKDTGYEFSKMHGDHVNNYSIGASILVNKT